MDSYSEELGTLTAELGLLPVLCALGTCLWWTLAAIRGRPTETKPAWGHVSKIASADLCSGDRDETRAWPLKDRTLVILVRVWCGWSLVAFRSSVLGRAKGQFASLNSKLYVESSGNVFMPLPSGLEILVKIF